MSRLFVFGDLHGGSMGELQFLTMKKFPEQKELTKEDVVIIAGDSAILWSYPEFKQGFKSDQKLAAELAARKFTLFIVPGNHENYDLLNALPLVDKWGGKVYVLTTKNGDIFFAKRGEVYEINDKKIFTFSGAKSHDLDYRHSLSELGMKKRFHYSQNRSKIKEVKISHINHWDQELPTEEECLYALDNLSKHSYKVDYVITHTCPEEIMCEFIHRTPKTKLKFEDPVALFLNEVNSLLEFKEWHFGHLHTNAKVETEDGVFMCHYFKKPYELGVK